MRVRLGHLICLGILFAAVYYHPANYWRSCWWDKWFFVMGACSLFISARVGSRYHWSLGLSLGYAMLSALWVFAWNSYPQVDVGSLLALGKISAYTYAALLTISMALVALTNEELTSVKSLFGYLCWVNAVVTIIQFVDGVPRTQLGGLFGNPSMSGCFTAFTYIVLLDTVTNVKTLDRYPRDVKLLTVLAAVIVPLIAIVLPGASQPVGVLSVMVISSLAYVNLKDRCNFERVALFVARSALVGAVCIFTGLVLTYKVGGALGSSGGFFGDSGRHEIWEMGLKTWYYTGHTFIGQGTGTSQLLLPLMQVDANHGMPHELWLWWHSDFIQALFENGYLGLAAHFVMLGFALRFAWGKAQWVFTSLCGVLASSVFNYTAHLPLHAFFGAFIIFVSFKKSYLNEEDLYDGQQD